jgi:tetratricopeptide (TPR) repeat protein
MNAIIRISILSALAACGGGSASSNGNGNGDGVRTANGTNVSEEAHAAWAEAVALFQRLDGQGWNEARCSQASDAFEGANDAQGGRFTEAIYMMGLIAERCGNADGAREHYNQALAVNERYCKARSAIGVGQLNAGQAGAAEQTFTRAIRDDNQCTEAYVNLAAIQRQRGGEQTREALNNLRRALAIESDYLPAFNQMALLYLDLAQGQNNTQMLDLAGVVCRQAQLINRDYAPIYNTWGLVNLRKDNLIEALSLFERARTLDPKMFEAHMNFGSITIAFRGYDDARTAFARAVELRPNSYDAHIGLGAALRGLRQLPQAQAEYERAIEIDANRPEAYFNLGIIFQDYMSGSVEDLNRAKGYYDQFIQRARSGSAFATVVEDVQRRCQQQQQQSGNRRRRRRSTDCRPGRLQNIEVAIDALRAMAEMQRQSEQQQQQQQQQPQGGGGE